MRLAAVLAALGHDVEVPENPAARAAIESPRNDIFVSTAYVREIAIETRLNKLTFAGSAAATIAANGFHAVPILPAGAEDASGLDLGHNAPFDRLLVAQAIRLGLTFATADQAMRGFEGVPRLWAGRYQRPTKLIRGRPSSRHGPARS